MRPYLPFWAKTSKAGTSSPPYHPVAFHGLDVAAAGRRLLLANADLRRRLARTCAIEEEPLLDWVTFLLALHDIGKMSDSFQGLRPDLMLDLQKRRTTGLDYGERHDALGLRLWAECLFPRLVERAALGLTAPFREDWRDLLTPWLSAVMGHHGQPVRLSRKEVFAKLFPASTQDAAFLRGLRKGLSRDAPSSPRGVDVPQIEEDAQRYVNRSPRVRG